MHRSKAQSLVLVTVAYVLAVAAGAAWLVWGPSATGSLLLDAFIADVLATLVIFIFSRAYRNSSFYDAFWSVIPPLLLVYWWAAGPLGLDSLRCWLVAIVVMYWAVRLTGNWVYGFPGLHHEDWRYPLLREGAGRWEFVADLFGIHLVPTVQVFLGMLPVYVAVTTPGGANGNAMIAVSMRPDLSSTSRFSVRFSSMSSGICGASSCSAGMRSGSRYGATV